MAFRSLKYTDIGKKDLRAIKCGSGSETLSFSLQICDLRIGTLRKFTDLRLRLSHYKFAVSQNRRTDSVNI
jgi:hypothetical protein